MLCTYGITFHHCHAGWWCSMRTTVLYIFKFVKISTSRPIYLYVWRTYQLAHCSFITVLFILLPFKSAIFLDLFVREFTYLFHFHHHRRGKTQSNDSIIKKKGNIKKFIFYTHLSMIISYSILPTSNFLPL